MIIQNTVIQGKEQINLFRMKTLLLGLRLEINTGMKLTNRAPSAYSIIKKEYGCCSGPRSSHS